MRAGGGLCVHTHRLVEVFLSPALISTPHFLIQPVDAIDSCCRRRSPQKHIAILHRQTFSAQDAIKPKRVHVLSAF